MTYTYIIVFLKHTGKIPVRKYIKMPIAAVSSFSVAWEQGIFSFFL